MCPPIEEIFKRNWILAHSLNIIITIFFIQACIVYFQLCYSSRFYDEACIENVVTSCIIEGEK